MVESLFEVPFSPSHCVSFLSLFSHLFDHYIAKPLLCFSGWVQCFNFKVQYMIIGPAKNKYIFTLICNFLNRLFSAVICGYFGLDPRGVTCGRDSVFADLSVEVSSAGNSSRIQTGPNWDTHRWHMAAGRKLTKEIADWGKIILVWHILFVLRKNNYKV